MIKSPFLAGFGLLLFILNFLQPGKAPGDFPHPQKDPYPFFVYNFGGLMNYTPERQIDMLSHLGYQGLAVQATSDQDVVRLTTYLDYAAKQHDFRIYAAFVRYNFNDAEKDRNRWKQVVDKIAGTNVNLWLIFGPKEPGIADEEVDRVLKEVTSYAGLRHVQVTLYPHSLCYIASAEQALPFVERNQSSNLKLAVHLCHEIRAGNGARINEVVQRVKQHIGFVSICGTDSVADWSTPLRMDTTTIKPLYRGNYDVRKFLRSLKSARYRGPVAFINFTIKDDVSEYLSRSIQTWNKLKQEIFK
jgi:sugar phosphate isomerase/epimerase